MTGVGLTPKKVVHVDAWTISEQPGDGTNYTHIVTDLGHYFSVIQDPVRKGAGLTKPTYFVKDHLVVHLEALSQITNVREYTDYVNNNMRHMSNENVCTLASAIRVCLDLMTEEAM